MAGITLEQAQTRLNEYLAAEAKILAGQRVEMDGRQLYRANLGEVQTGIDIWDKRVKNLTQSATGRGRSRAISPRF